MVNQPHKVCPTCGQPAVLAMPQCRRCGYFYPPVVGQPAVGYARALSAGSQRELDRAAGRGSGAVNAGWWIAGLIAAALVGIALVVVRANRAGSAPVAAAGGQHAAASTGMRDPMAGMFVESEGRAEAPTLSITNADYDAMNLLLKDPAGRVYHLTAQPMATSTLQVPAGRYDVAVTSDNPAIRPNYGDALFRAHKEYSATFVQSPDFGHLHLGD